MITQQHIANALEVRKGILLQVDS